MKSYIPGCWSCCWWWWYWRCCRIGCWFDSFCYYCLNSWWFATIIPYGFKICCYCWFYCIRFYNWYSLSSWFASIWSFLLRKILNCGGFVLSYFIKSCKKLFFGLIWCTSSKPFTYFSKLRISLLFMFISEPGKNGWNWF